MSVVVAEETVSCMNESTNQIALLAASDEFEFRHVTDA